MSAPEVEIDCNVDYPLNQALSIPGIDSTLWKQFLFVVKQNEDDPDENALLTVQLTNSIEMLLSSLTQNVGVATATFYGTLSGSIVTGTKLMIYNASDPGYDLIGAVTVTGASSFTYPVAAGTSTPSTGSFWASLGQADDGLIVQNGYTPPLTPTVASDGFLQLISVSTNTQINVNLTAQGMHILTSDSVSGFPCSTRYGRKFNSTPFRWELAMFNQSGAKTRMQWGDFVVDPGIVHARSIRQ